MQERKIGLEKCRASRPAQNSMILKLLKSLNPLLQGLVVFLQPVMLCLEISRDSATYCCIVPIVPMTPPKILRNSAIMLCSPELSHVLLYSPELSHVLLYSPELSHVLLYSPHGPHDSSKDIAELSYILLCSPHSLHETQED
jgi:hypothetical protein